MWRERPAARKAIKIADNLRARGTAKRKSTPSRRAPQGTVGLGQMPLDVAEQVESNGEDRLVGY